MKTLLSLFTVFLICDTVVYFVKGQDFVWSHQEQILDHAGYVAHELSGWVRSNLRAGAEQAERERNDEQ